MKRSEIYSQKEKAPHRCFFFLVEHRGLEPLTPTLPVWCAPNCANAPSTLTLYHITHNLSRPNPYFFRFDIFFRKNYNTSSAISSIISAPRSSTASSSSSSCPVSLLPAFASSRAGSIFICSPVKFDNLAENAAQASCER